MRHFRKTRIGSCLASFFLITPLLVTLSWADQDAAEFGLERVPRDQIQSKSAVIDTLMSGALSQAGVQPNERCSDEIFCDASIWM